MRRCSGRMTKPPAYPFRYLAMSNSTGPKQTADAKSTWRQQPARPKSRRPVTKAGTLPSKPATNRQVRSQRSVAAPSRATQVSRFRPPRPSQRPRRSVKRYLGGTIRQSKHKKSPKPQVRCKWLKIGCFPCRFRDPKQACRRARAPGARARC